MGTRLASVKGSNTSGGKSSDAAAQHYPYIDALRGFAFLGVLVTHASQEAGPFRFSSWAWLGNLGVQLFFIASALTLFLSISQRSQREAAPILNFFIRRFFRIAPLFWFGIILYCFVPVREHGVREFEVGVWHYLATALFIHGWNVETMNSVVPGGWSIAVEMMFYLFVPLLWRFIRDIESAGWWLIGALLITPMMDRLVVWMFNLDVNDALVSLFLGRWLPAQAPVFLLGILLYHTIQAIDPRRKSIGVGCLLLVSSALMLHSFKGFNGAQFFPQPIPLSCALWVFALSLHIHPNALLVNRLTCFMGKVSYSGYITHFAVVALLTYLFPPSQIILRLQGNAGVYFLFLLAAALPATLFVSWITYNLIERPGLDLGRTLIRRLEARTGLRSVPAL